MTPEQIERWLENQLAQKLKLPKEEIDPTRPIEEYGFDSLEAVALTGEIEKTLGKTLDPTILWDYPTIRALATFLGQPTD